MATNLEDIDGSTVDGAAARLSQMRPEAPDEAAEAEDSGVEEVIEDAPLEAQEDDLDTEQTEEVLDEEDEYQEDYAPTLEPPSSWSGDAKEKWSQLPDDIKEVIVARDKDRDRGIHQRLNELAEQEKALKAAREEAAQAAEEARQRLERFSTDELKPPPKSLLDVNSEDYDPDKYHLLRAEYEERKEAADEQRRESRRQQEEEAKKYREALQEQVEASKAKLLQRFPSWAKDPQKGIKAIGELRDYMVQTGVTRDVAEKVYDADMLTYIWKARQYDLARKAKQTEAKPRVSRPAARKAPPRESDVRKAEKTFRESGSVDDAARLLAAQRKK